MRGNLAGSGYPVRAIALFGFIALAVMLSFMLPGCGGVSEPSQDKDAVTLDDCPVVHDTSFGGVYIDIPIDDFNQLGFAFGDCVDIVFSNGYELRDIPYYNGYYVNVGSPLLVGYPGYPSIEAAINYGDCLWDIAELTDSDTATVTLVESGAFLDVQEAFDISYTNEREGRSDRAFGNFRALSGGRMKTGTVYRSASPIDNEYARADTAEVLMQDAGIAFVLNLSDNEEEALDFVAAAREQGVDTSYYQRLWEQGEVVFLDLGASYPSDDFAEELAKGLTEMAGHEGPYLVHCIEGKDRTGFVCILLEALCGASYDEMIADYMATFENYYGITEAGDPSKYDAIVHLNPDGMLAFLADAGEDADLAAIDYTEPARTYLKRGGMSDAQIDELVARLCG